MSALTFPPVDETALARLLRQRRTELDALTVVAECASLGHDWTPWDDYLCRSTLTDPRLRCHQVRTCWRCPAIETCEDAGEVA